MHIGGEKTRAQHLAQHMCCEMAIKNEIEKAEFNYFLNCKT